MGKGRNNGNSNGQQDQQQGGQFTADQFQDKDITCKEGQSCLTPGGTFTWTAGEQAFYANKGFDTPPVRCKPCRDRNKEKRDQGGQRAHR